MDKENLEKRNYQVILTGEQINRFLNAVEEYDVATIHDIEDILKEAVAVQDLFKMVNPEFILEDGIQERYGNPHEWSCEIDVVKRTIKVIDTV